MDRRERERARQVALDPAARERQAVDRARAGDLEGCARLVRAGLEAGVAMDGALDRLTPESLDALEPIPLSERAEDALRAPVWRSNDELLVVEERALDPLVLRWRLGQAPEPLFARTLQAPPDPLHFVADLGGLALDASGRWLAFAGRHVGYVAFTRAGGPPHQWARLDLATGRAEAGPLLRGVQPTTWWRGRVIGVGARAIWSWAPGEDAEPRQLTAAVDAAAGVGTCLTQRGGKLGFRSLDTGALVAERPYPISPLPAGWRGLLAAWGQRAVIYDRARGRVLLHGLDGELGGAPLPAADLGKLVAVRPCPSGWVVALRYKQKRHLGLVDLRTGERRVVEVARSPRDLAWSPSGRRLALAARRGAVLVLAA